MSAFSRLASVLRGAARVVEHIGEQAAPEMRRSAILVQNKAQAPRLSPSALQSAAAGTRATTHTVTPSTPAAAEARAEAAKPEPEPASAAPKEARVHSVGTDASAAGANAEPGGEQRDVRPEAVRASAPDPEDTSGDSAWTEESYDGSSSEPSRVAREAVAVPSSSFARAYEFTKLGAAIMSSSVSAATSRSWRSITGGKGREGEDEGSVVMSERNAELMAGTLSKLRGAALKVGQILSLQDEHAVPPQLQAVFNRVRASAHTMPREQLERTLDAELGEGWREKLRSFGDEPIASASIGQVHRGVLRQGGSLVAIKVQYPGVADSIDSDLANLKRLAVYTGMLPKRLFIDNIIAFAKDELLVECDYTAEADHTERYRDLVAAKGEEDPAFRDGFAVPAVHRELSSARVLTTDWMAGGPIDAVASMSAGRRNSVAARILDLTLTELFQWRFMQTDPNWGNYLYHAPSDTVSLIDFGASREYPRPFVDEYFRMVDACARGARGEVVDASVRMGFLTGNEPQEMVDAHVGAALILGEPFGAREPYDFATSGLSTRVREHVPTMLRLRERPPPTEIYSLHRKLSGAYMLCIRLGATIDCRTAFDRLRAQYEFGPERLGDHSAARQEGGAADGASASPAAT